MLYDDVVVRLFKSYFSKEIKFLLFLRSLIYSHNVLLTFKYFSMPLSAGLWFRTGHGHGYGYGHVSTQSLGPHA